MTGFTAAATRPTSRPRSLIKANYGDKPEVFAASLQGFFGLNEQQAAVMASFTPDQLGGLRE